MATKVSPPMFRAAKYYEADERKALAGPLAVRNDVLLRFTAPTPLEGEKYSARPLVVAELRNAAILRDGGFVFTERGEVLRESVDRLASLKRLMSVNPELEAALVRKGPACVLGGQRIENYYHWWIDTLARVWLNEASPYANCPLVVTRLTKRFQRESLDLLGVRVEEMTAAAERFDYLIFAAGLAHGAADAISADVVRFAAWCRQRLALSTAIPRRKLFLSRAMAKYRHIVNEDDVLAILPVDFERVDTEPMSVREQALLFSQAAVVVAPHGAGLTNLLFARPGALIIELVPAMDPPVTYEHLAMLLGHRYRRVRCEQVGDVTHNWTNRDLFADVQAVADALDCWD